MERQPPDEQRPDHVARYKFAKDVINWAARKLPEPSYDGRILDAACGTGYGSAILAKKFSCVGVDIDEGAIETAREWFPQCDFVQGDVRERVWHGKFRGVTCFETIEHIENPEIALKLFRDDAEVLVASVPNERGFPFDAEKFKGNKYPHLRHYTHEEFTALLDSCGWSVLLKCQQLGKDSSVTTSSVMNLNAGRTLVYVAI